MATYHLRMKNDTQPSGTKISAKRHADYILREEGKAHADYIKHFYEIREFLVKQVEYAWLALSNSPAYKSANLEDKTFSGLNRNILSGLARIQTLKRKIVGFLHARENHAHRR